MFSSKSLLQTVYEPIMNSSVCCVSINLDFENSLKERFPSWFGVWQSISGLRISRSNCDIFLLWIRKLSNWGRTGIRTLGTLQFSGFQDRHNRPLCHPSNEFLLAQRGWWSITINPKRSLNLLNSRIIIMVQTTRDFSFSDEGFVTLYKRLFW